ncbi:hypothetical protein [Yoonia litorea]|uniref:Transferrin-binding protein B C-lobe/N-lobe beta barrel domain-containing protein n=1 Tax=Yoonia litorea TaxID=1123755 RepID=A0A1I6MLU0_9RHOB|nr:hypothetical protein [Yoonia litorea]SFS16568.1 hypothetical protein SAMN05444714_2013 [Yoonia litorea]
MMGKHMSCRAVVIMTPFLLAACGGGGGGGANTEPVDFSTADAAAAALIDQYVDANGNAATGQTRSNSFLQTGTVNYAGAFNGNLGGNGVVGDVTIAVAFGGGDVTGSLRNLQNEASGAYTGSLQASGSLNKDATALEPQMSLTFDGSLGNSSGAQAVTLLLDGNFFAHDGNPEGAVAGPVDGTIGGVLLDDGLFAAED